MNTSKTNNSEHPSTHKVRTVEAVINLNGVGGGNNFLKIREVPVPVTFEYLAAQLASDRELSLLWPLEITSHLDIISHFILSKGICNGKSIGEGRGCERSLGL